MVTKVEKIKKIVRNERTLEILELLSKFGFVLFLGVAAPNAAGHIIKLLGWAPDYRNNYRTKRTLSSLQKRGFIKFWTKNNKGVLELTNDGKLHFAYLKAKSIKLPRKPNWDGLWRIVTFDIPENLKKNRKRFSEMLNIVGMQNLEKSVFVYPHECKENIFKIADLYEVRKYTRYIVATSIEPKVKIQNFFVFTKQPPTRL